MHLQETLSRIDMPHDPNPRLTTAGNPYFRYLRVLLYVSIPLLLCSCINKNKAATDGPDADTTAVLRPKHLSILFGGDIMVHAPQITAAKKENGYDFSETFQYIKPLLDSAGLAVLNFETTISADGSFSGYPLFASPPEIVYALKKAGADILMLANNHICDKGAKGIRATVSTIEQAGLLYTGAFADSAAFRRNHPLYKEAGGIKTAILNYTYGTNGMPVPEGMIVNLIDEDKIARDIASVNKDTTDHIIVFLHWGDEYARAPHKYQKKIADVCHGNGADIVIGSHPHVIQPVDVITDSTGHVTGITVYSLGNLVSNQQWRYSDGGMLWTTDITHDTDGLKWIRSKPTFVWVHTPYEDGRKKYKILTPEAADTMLLNYPASLSRYKQFVGDSRKIIYGDSVPRNE